MKLNHSINKYTYRVVRYVLVYLKRWKWLSLRRDTLTIAAWKRDHSWMAQSRAQGPSIYSCQLMFWHPNFSFGMPFFSKLDLWHPDITTRQNGFSDPSHLKRTKHFSLRVICNMQFRTAFFHCCTKNYAVLQKFPQCNLVVIKCPSVILELIFDAFGVLFGDYVKFLHCSEVERLP